MKFSIFVLIVFLFSGCSGKTETKKTITLSSGRAIEVSFEKQDHKDRDPILFVDYINEEKVIKEKTVEDEAQEIWNAVKNEADKSDVKEALIKYTYYTGHETEGGEKEMGSVLFDAEKTESGDWKLRKVN